MKTARRTTVKRRGPRKATGGVLVYALIVMVVGGTLLAGWVNLVAARGFHADTRFEAMQRRVALSNGVMLARQLALGPVMFGTSGDARSVSLAGGWGGFSCGVWDGSPFASTANSIAVNHFSPGNFGGYTFDVPVTISAPGVQEPMLLQVRSRSPFFSNELLVMHTPPSGVALSTPATLEVAGGTFLWRPNPSAGFAHATESYATPTFPLPTVTLQNAAGQPVRMRNLGLPRMTSGISMVTGGYDGTLNTVHNVETQENSLSHKLLAGDHVVVDGMVEGEQPGVFSDGSGTVMIDLGSPALSSVYMPGNVSTLVLQGQDSPEGLAEAGDLPAVMVVVNQDATSAENLSVVQFTHNNNRRVYLGVKKNAESAVVCDFPGSDIAADWRLCATFERVPLGILSYGGPIQLRGGLRTDRSIDLFGGAMAIVAETEPGGLESMADRQAWVEIYRE